LFEFIDDLAPISAIGLLEAGDPLLHPQVDTGGDFFSDIADGEQLLRELLKSRHRFANDGGQRAGMFFEEKPQFGKREQIVRSPDKVFGIFGAFGLIEPCQVLDAVLVKASEKVCDPGLPAGRAGASAWPTNDADARAASAFATRPTCRAIESPGAPIRALAPAGIVRMMAAQFNPCHPIR